MAQTVNRLSATQETQVRSLGWENLLEKDMHTGVRPAGGGDKWTETRPRVAYRDPYPWGHLPGAETSPL